MTRILTSCSQFTTEIANELLANQLGPIKHVEVLPLGEGVGLMSSIARAVITTENGEKRVVVKCVAQNENSDISKGLNFYTNEINFYRHLAADCPIESPPCLYAEIEPDTQNFLLILDDMGSEFAGNQLVGCSESVMMEAFRKAAELHGKYWNRTDALPFLNSQVNDEMTVFRRDGIFKPGVEPTIQMFPEYIDHEMADAIRAIGDQFFELFNRAMSKPLTVVHGDYRTDNMFIFDEAAGTPRIVSVDWQNTASGNGTHDIAYFRSQSCREDLDTETEMAALRHYYQTLIDAGVEDYSFEECVDDYRYNLLIVMITPIAVCGTLDPGNERGMELGRLMLTRSLGALKTMNCTSLL